MQKSTSDPRQAVPKWIDNELAIEALPVEITSSVHESAAAVPSLPEKTPTSLPRFPMLYDLLFQNQNFSSDEPLSELFRFRRAVRKIEPKSAE